MADDILGQLWLASQSGDGLRRDWLEELVWHPEGRERLRELGRDADQPTILALMDLLHDYADASRRNASKKRRKTTEEGVSWQRELVAHLREHGPKTKLAKFRSLPRKRSHDEDDPLENTLSLCGGKWQVYRDPDDRIVCVEEATGIASSISLATFEDYLKSAPKGR